MANTNLENRTTEANRGSMQGWQRERGLSSRRGESSLFRPADFFSSDPFAVMRHFREEMDRTIGRIFGSSMSSMDAGGESSFWSPAIDVTQREGQLLVHAELPGLKPEEVKVELAADSLIIEGERRMEQEENKGGAYRSERKYGRFYREIPLPEGANTEEAKAQFRDGVLEVTVPVPEQRSNRRSIPIETGSSSQTASGQIRSDGPSSANKNM
jgi:HSP20 family protein